MGLGCGTGKLGESGKEGLTHTIESEQSLLIVGSVPALSETDVNVPDVGFYYTTHWLVSSPKVSARCRSPVLRWEPFWLLTPAPVVPEAR